MPFGFKRLDIPDVILIQPKVFEDERGFFMETYKYPDFVEFGIKDHFLQYNHSRSIKKGILRGLHYQKDPMAQGKLVSVVIGEIFDVAVDIRKSSPYYGKWLGVIMSSKNKNMLFIPPGFAHGFCTLSDVTEIIYQCTNIYSPEDERGIIWNDPNLKIDWPVKNPVLSEKDSSFPTLDKADNNFVYSCG